MLERGKFIVFDGVDNSGKTTVAKIIWDMLEKEYGISASLTHHPGSTPVGKEIRQLLKHSPHDINPNAQALLFAADNSMFMNQILKPNLVEGKWVLGDRNNFVSSLAYQIASGCSWDELDKIHSATAQTDKIDLLFIFRCRWDESQRRRALKGDDTPDRYEDSGREYFEKLVNCYDRIVEEQSERLAKFVKFTGGRINCYYIDANRPLDQVLANVKEIIVKRFPELQALRSSN
jgi:dTMP kinase